MSDEHRAGGGRPLAISPSYARLFLIDDLGAARFRPSQELGNAGSAHLALTNDGDLLVMAGDRAAILWSAAIVEAAEMSQ